MKLQRIKTKGKKYKKKETNDEGKHKFFIETKAESFGS